jgi:hypothetical protein
LSIIIAAQILASVLSVSPLPADGLLLWFDAADRTTLQLDGDQVLSWKSKAPGPEQAASSPGTAHPLWRPHEGTPLRPAIFFDGDDDVLVLPEFAKQADAWTLVVACAPRQPVKGGALCTACPAKGNDFDPGFTVDLYQSSTAFDQISIEGAGRMGGQKDQMQSSLACGGMHVVAVVRDSKEVRLYIDGKLEGTRPVSPAKTVMDEFRIGARFYEGAERAFFHGEIAQVLFYGRALGDSERVGIDLALAVSEAERVAGEKKEVEDAKQALEERMKNRMKAPHVVQSWPTVQAFQADTKPPQDLSALPVRTDLHEAITLASQHLNSLFDRDRDNEPFFFANCMADGTGKMLHSVNIGIPHVVGRCLVGSMEAELCAGVPFPADGLAILERYLKSSFDNPDHLNSYFDPEKGGARCIEFHNMREGLYGLWALAAGRGSAWARETGHAMLETLDRITDDDGCWSVARIEQLGMKDRCFGVAIPNTTRLVDPLLAWDACTQDPLAMKLAGLYARRGLATMYTPDGHFAPMDKSSGHVHSITSSLSGITAYAVKTGDKEMLEACGRIMEVGVPEYFSSWGWGDEVFPDHPADVPGRGEMNQTGDVVRAALILGGAGYPQYYELAERYLRSMLLPTQHLEAEMRAYLRDKEQPADDSERDVVKRSIGGYAMQLPNARMRKGDWPVTTLDITSGAVHAMSECWRHRMDVNNGEATLNLLFDCDNDMLTVKSGLPIEGRITFTAKETIKQFRMALPGWLDASTPHVTVNGQSREVRVVSGYLELGALDANAEGAITFAVPCKREKETVDNVEYTTTWIGSQIIEILPRGEVGPLPF